MQGSLAVRQPLQYLEGRIIERRHRGNLHLFVRAVSALQAKARMVCGSAKSVPLSE